MSFTVAIVGRPNVGKSTLFNRLTGDRDAIVDDISGVTRDRKYGSSFWNGKNFDIIDTGGFVPNSEDVFEKAIREQVEIAISEASLIIFMVDVTTSITDLDSEMASLLRQTTKPVFLVVNKVDNHLLYSDATEFYSLGFSELHTVSSLSGSGTGDLLDAITEHIAEAVIEDENEKKIPKFAIVGQPNVGKSSLLNALIGETRNIVTDIAGTTRDSIHTHYNLFQKDFLLIDTAGIRKKAKVKENLEFYSVMRAIKAIDEADVCLVLIDAQIGIEAQDLAIFKIAQDKKKGLVVLVNKWDIVENKTTNSVRDYTEYVKKKVAPMSDIPVIFISALEKTRIFKGIETALEVYENRNRRIPTSQLNEVMQAVIEKYPPPSFRGLNIRIKYITQLPTPTPTFAFFTNHPKYIRSEYKSYLENQLRSHFNFTGVPINIYIREK